MHFLRCTLALTAGAAVLATGCDWDAETGQRAGQAEQVAERAVQQAAGDPETVQPAEAGDRLPQAELRTLEGDMVLSDELYRSGPVVLVFYRGGWCPYCTTHLRELAEVESDLAALGYELVAVSPDTPENLRQTMGELDLSYRLVSDSQMSLARALGIAFQVDPATRVEYEGHGIDLAEAAGQRHYELPVPAVFIVDDTGTIRYRHHDPDYTQRLDGEELIAAAEGE